MTTTSNRIMNAIGDKTLQVLFQIIAGIGALNWLSLEFFDTDLLVDTIGLTGDTYTAVIAVIGVAGALAVYNASAWFTDGDE
ncbi:DUF378 domain-containing protein [Halovenus aranensis]|uniref:DUF378 domain-containing protein n=1 Tax=Halovenus aranensis TaxID=890420 RepID=UPI00117A6D5E|nr:hypothetical protein [Halovenus aranensis]